MLYVVIVVAVFGIGLLIYSPLVLSGTLSRFEEQDKPLDQAEGLPCRICAVLESAHFWIDGHQWSV